MSDKFIETGEGVIVSQCAYCKHLSSDPSSAICTAFPGQIPAEILANDYDHRQPWIDPRTGQPGDQGIALSGSITLEFRDDVTPDVRSRVAERLDDTSETTHGIATFNQIRI